MSRIDNPAHGGDWDGLLSGGAVAGKAPLACASTGFVKGGFHPWPTFALGATQGPPLGAFSEGHKGALQFLQAVRVTLLGSPQGGHSQVPFGPDGRPALKQSFSQIMYYEGTGPNKSIPPLVQLPHLPHLPPLAPPNPHLPPLAPLAPPDPHLPPLAHHLSASGGWWGQVGASGGKWRQVGQAGTSGASGGKWRWGSSKRGKFAAFHLKRRATISIHFLKC